MPTAKPKTRNRASNSSRRDQRNPHEQTIVDKVERETRAPVRPRRKHQQRNGDDVDNDRRKHDTQTTALDRNFTRAFDNHEAIYPTPSPVVNQPLLNSTLERWGPAAPVILRRR